MKERPILFSAPMVRALLDGSKTQARRVVKRSMVGYPKCTVSDSETGIAKSILWVDDEAMFSCPYGKPGDRLWVREKFQPVWADGFDFDSEVSPNYKTGFGYQISYPATDKIIEWIDGYDNITSRCKLSIHMPRWASRINLEITAVRVERLNDISEADAKAEGLKYHPLYKEWGGVEAHPCSRPDCPQWRWYETPQDAFKYLWESINGAGSWQANPWVWVVEFKAVKSC